ncbi:glutathione S-transferase family protein [Kiloniella sp.]|uniref:glutathione S-transferase family protein n=1 Tax=Kiloniella sp. TaxID=1938587 RepID=UPI003B022B61
MDRMHLIIGNKNYSSWSLRPWLAMKVAGLDFEETIIPLFQDGTKAKLLSASPMGTVPVLQDQDLTISDSLAILEYLNEKHPEANLMPASLNERAKLRSICSEMHSGFFALRGAMPMNTRKKTAIELTEDVLRDIKRIKSIWLNCLMDTAAEEPYLFGHFTIADAMFAPVVSRFKTYGIELDPVCAKYADKILNLPAMKEWYEAGSEEPWIIQASEIE